MQYDAVALFSGGLDSILAVKLVTDQGLKVKCLHYATPFFGQPHKVAHWERVYGLDIECIDIGEMFVEMIVAGPPHDFGKVMNPCVDCKILMMQCAKKRMEELGAAFIISGEVLGQRPMSQRRDTLNVIRRDGGVHDLLLRPLSAVHLAPTQAEESGLVDRARLRGFSGRGRSEQLALAKSMSIDEIPTPAGGCMLAEKENARRYWPLIQKLTPPTAKDFYLANLGRQHWFEDKWLCVGRHAADNEAIERFVREADMLIKVADMPGPLALARRGLHWDNELLAEAAAFTASFSPAAVRLGKEVIVRLWQKGRTEQEISIMPSRQGVFATPIPPFDSIKQAFKERYRAIKQPE